MVVMILIVFAFLFAVVPIRTFIFVAMLRRRMFGLQVATNMLAGAICILILSGLFGHEESAPKTLFVLFFVWAFIETLSCIWSASRWLIALRKR